MRSLLVIVCFLGLTCTPVAISHENSEEDVESNFDLSFYIENDISFLSLWGSDHNYTNGMRLSYLFAENDGPQWGRALGHTIPAIRRALHDPNAQYNFGLAVGHHMYTPTNITSRSLEPLDRPYGAWLYASLLFHLKKNDTLQTFAVDFGIVGPWALGRPIQNTVHGIFGYPRPQGWAHQINNEPGLNLYYQQKHRLLEWLPGKYRSFDLLPYYGFAIGNVFTHAQAGAMARLGFNIANDFGPTGVSPVAIDSFIDASEDGVRTSGFWKGFVFVGAEGRGVVRNTFLDGNTFTESHHVSKRFWIYEYQIGASLRMNGFRLTWRRVTRSPEFLNDESTQTYGSISLTYSNRI